MRSPPNAASWTGVAEVAIGERRIRVAAGTDVGTTYAVNEDGVGLDVAQRLALVFDGSGGSPPGIVAALALDAAFGHSDPAAALTAANHALHRRVLDEDDDWGGGAAAIAAVLHADGALIAHAGDCRAALWSGGELRRLTRDHSLLNTFLDAGHALPEDPAAFPHRNVITRVLGLCAEVELERTRVAYRPGDRLVLTTAGVHEAVDDLAPLVALPDVAHAVTAILAAARQRGHDNATVLLAELR